MADSPLTDEERRFAEENHNMIYDFIHKRNLNLSDFYGLLACRFVKAVKDWFSNPSVRKYAFSTIAYRSMNSAYASFVRDAQRPKNKCNAVSLQEPIDDGSDATLEELIGSKDSVEDIVLSKAAISDAFNQLNSVRQRVVRLKCQGYSQMEIARKTGLRQDYICKLLKDFKKQCIG